MPNFNSIKVRLEPSTDAKKQTVEVFQFHKGAIRTIVDLSLNAFDNYFNSIKVRLEHMGVVGSPLFRFNFNSIKVRLELKAEKGVKISLPNFNSIKVRLEHSA